MTKDQKIKDLKRQLRDRNRLIKDLQRAISVGNDYTDHIQRVATILLDNGILTLKQYTEIFGQQLCQR